MSDKIKEILDKPKILMLSYGNYISLDDYVKLKDYITNLQQENQKNKKIIKDVYNYLDEKKRCTRMVGHRLFYMYEYVKRWEIDI